MADRALFELLPALRETLPLHPIGDLPTPVVAVPALEELNGTRPGRLYLKRDDLSSSVYGGNKVRTLEVFFGEAKRRGYTHVFSTGTFGSNHAVATVVHAPRAGLIAAALLYPQPPTVHALDNARVIAALATPFVALPHWSALPIGLELTKLREALKGHRSFFMVPGGATPLGALGYVNAALELARDVEHGVLPRPSRIVVPGGSGCTTAGLLAGVALAARLGIGFAAAEGPPPEVLSVRVTPWPVTSRYRLVHLAERTSRLLATLAGDRSLAASRESLAKHLRVDGRFLGAGYGFATEEGERAAEWFRRAGGPALESTYSAKAGAGLLRALHEHDDGPVVFWTTCSAVTPSQPTALPARPRAVLRWLAQGLSRR